MMMKKIHALILSIAAVILMPLGTSAISGADFNPARIIDDLVFFNKNSMTVQQIQDFLNSKVPTCDSNHAGFIGGTGTLYNPPFICLKDFYENPDAPYTVNFTYKNTSGVDTAGSRTYYENNSYRYTSLTPVYKNGDYTQGYSLKGTMTNIAGVKPAGAISAAQIIYNAAQTYNINPQVLLITLQKEQGLVTDTWPAAWQYQASMGYGCPDTAPCSSGYAGFSRQVFSAAYQFRQYTDNPDSYNFKGGTTRYVQYNPTASCGGTNVAIVNQATANLYNYTPYQPNAGALANMSDSSAGGSSNCGAYGNRNFFWYFNKWFGSTYAPSYSYNIVSQTYTPSGGTEQNYVDGIPATPGDIFTLKVVLKNSSNQTWYNNGNNPVQLATWLPSNRKSLIEGSGWISPYRPATMQESSVAPGSNATFLFNAIAPGPNNGQNNFGEYFNLVMEGKSWFPVSQVIRFNFNLSANYSWRLISQTYGSSKTNYNDGIPASLGDTIPVTVKLQNTGTANWYKSGKYPVNIATWNPTYSASPVYENSWSSAYRPAGLVESIVKPGDTGTFNFNLKANKNGNYAQYFNLVAEGITWFPYNQMLRFNMNVNSYYGWQVVSQSYGDSIPNTNYVDGVPMSPGTTKKLKIVLKNTGNTTWIKNNNPVRLATWLPSYRTSLFQSSDWISDVRAAELQENTVSPGENGTFIFTVTAPKKQGNYGEYFNLVAEGLAWFPYNGVLRFNFNVWL